ncbi:MAG: IPT/TIG domain-containing protein [Acidimicrobiales bacterium]
MSAWTTSGFESSPATLILSTARFPTFPTVTSINPSQGPDAGGTNVTIRGSGFSPKPERTVFNFGPGRAVRDVSCSSSTTCTASTPPASVGSIDVTATVNGESSTPNPPGDEFSYVGSPGGVWTPVQALLPKGGKPPANLHAVACWSATACVATGGYYDSSGVFQGLIESLSGGAWIPTKAPLPRGVADDLNVYLAGVACPAPGWCVVTGSYGVGTGAVGLIETLTGGLWTAAEAPLPRGAANNAIVGLRALTCPSTSSCVATGDYVDSSNHGQGLIESFSGGTWTPTEAPLPVGVDGASSDPEAQIESVVCASTSTCVATGDYLDADGDELGVIETLSSATWKPTEAIVPTFPSFDLGPVACPSTSSCVAVGDYNALPGDEGFFETLSDGTWRPTEAPLPTGASSVLANVSLAFVACASTSSCVAGGHYFDTNGDEQGLIEMLTEGIWKPTEAPLPADVGSSPEAELRSVACFDATACVAVGTYRDSNGNQQDLIEQTG